MANQLTVREMSKNTQAPCSTAFCPFPGPDNGQPTSGGEKIKWGLVNRRQMPIVNNSTLTNHYYVTNSSSSRVSFAGARLNTGESGPMKITSFILLAFDEVKFKTPSAPPYSKKQPLICLSPHYHVMKNNCIAIILAVAALFSDRVLGQNLNQSSAILGCQRAQLIQGWQLVGPPFEPFPVAHGTLNAFQANVVSVTGDINGGINRWAGYLMRMTSGTASGRQYVVTANDTNDIDLSTNISAEGFAVGDSYELLPTIEEFLGDQLADSGTNAEGTNQLGTYINGQPLVLQRGVNGQWLDNAGSAWLIAVISGQGFWLSPASSCSVLLTGVYNGGPGATWISSGEQVISFPFSSAVASLGTVNWQGAVAGSVPNAADQLGFWDATNGVVNTCWLNSTNEQWQWMGNGTSAGNPSFVAGQGYLYNHVGTGFYLSRP